MIAPIRSSALATTARRATSAASTPTLRRAIATKAERWTQQDAQAALESPESKVSLKDVVPQIEARWSGMSKVEQYAVYRQLEEIQRKDWKELSLDEKKAGEYGRAGERERHVYSTCCSTGLLLILHSRHYQSLPHPAYFVSFGPHGPRRPITQPGQAMRTAVGVSALMGATAVVFFGMRHYASPPPKTMTKEYQEQTNEKAREENLNPITGKWGRGRERDIIRL